MFTGLVEGQGTVISREDRGAGVRIVVRPDSGCCPPDQVSIGESISISGCCLTVVAVCEDSFAFDAGEETLSKTWFSDLHEGRRVNLERSLAVGDRLGGHFVQGHVDGTARVDEVRQNDEWTDIRFRVPQTLTDQLVSKGSVAVDGVSLTVAALEDGQFSVALIPHTLEITTLGQLKVGDIVNLELDILGKYVARLLRRDS